MCGIVGLFLKNSSLHPELGALIAPMLAVMSERGPDSAGFAVYGAGQTDIVKVTLRWENAQRAAEFLGSAQAELLDSGSAVAHDSHVVLRVPASQERAILLWLEQRHPECQIVSVGKRMEIYKEVGLPTEVADRFAWQP